MTVLLEPLGAGVEHDDRRAELRRRRQRPLALLRLRLEAGAGAGAKARPELIVEVAAHPSVGGELVAVIYLLALERDAGKLGQLLAGELGVEPALGQNHLGLARGREGGVAGGRQVLPLAAGDALLKLAHPLVDAIRRLGVERLPRRRREQGVM